MGKLFNWLIGIAAVATTAYVLNTYSISRTTNGVNFKGPKSDTILTYDNDGGSITNSFVGKNGNIETTLGRDSNGFFGSYRMPDINITGRLNPQAKNSNVKLDISDFLSDWFWDYDSANSFNKWGFDGMTNNHSWSYRRL